MVNLMLLLVAMLPGRALVLGSGFPKDSTTNWCSTIPDVYDGAVEVYRCYPNPWGSGSTHFYVRFSDTSKIKGCLLGAANLSTKFVPQRWIFIGGAWGPFIPKFTFDQDGQCLQQTGVVNTATLGDSVDLEFWFTPVDTVVTDTIRGTFKALYRGDILPANWVPVHPRAPVPSIRWTRAGLRSSAPIPGPVHLVDLRGKICPLRVQPSLEGALLVPARTLAPGVYHLSWSEGRGTVLIPKE